MTNRIERERSHEGGRFYIPAPIVYGVIVGLVLTAIGGGATGLVTALKFNQALDKINGLPSPSMYAERRRNQRQMDRTQNQRIDRLEQSVFDMRPFKHDAFSLSCAPLAPWPSAPGASGLLRVVLHDKRRPVVVKGRG